MKTFRYKLVHVAGQTMTVSELRDALAKYPPDMPVLAEWEGCLAYIEGENFSVREEHKGHEDDKCECLIIWVENY